MVSNMRRAVLQSIFLTLLASACQSATREVVAPSVGPSKMSPSSPGTTASILPPTGRDKRLIRALIRFTHSPSPETATAVPLADDGVWLGLADRLLMRRSAAELADPKAWELDVEIFRAYVGPFSALEFLARPEPTIISVGPHPRCVSAPVPPPTEVANLRRLSVQPRDRESCLQWWTVDLFLTPGGRISAVTLDFFEP